MLLLMLTAREGRLSIRRQRFAHPANCRATPRIAARDRSRVPRRRCRRSPQRQNRRIRRSFKPALTDAKIRGEELKLLGATEPAPPPVTDILEALKASLARAKKPVLVAQQPPQAAPAPKRTRKAIAS